MPLPVYRLRRLLAAIAILLTLAVAGMYFYARSKAQNALKTVPGKIGYDIKQTAQGFQISKSDGKRTLFTVQASNLKEFKLNGNAELHNVSIILYGRDSSRFDQIYGDDFAYNQKTGDVTAKGEVQIDLVANPTGLQSADQTAPKELRNPIHLKTRDLVFNKDSGNAWTDARVEFRTPQASGWAVGVKYAGKTSTLTLSSQIHIELSGPEHTVLDARRGIITNDPRHIMLEAALLRRADGTVGANEATFYLDSENHVERVLATGDVIADMPSIGVGSNHLDKSSQVHGRADSAELLLPAGQDRVQTATLSGNVHFEELGAQNVAGEAGRVIFDFAGQNELQKVHAVDGARLTQNMANSSTSVAKGNSQQNFDLTAPVIDFTVADGRVLKQAVTSGPARITIAPAQASTPGSNQASEQTVVTAGRFLANFTESGGQNHLASAHGAPDVHIANSVPGQPDRVSTSDSVDAAFLPQGGIESITQKGNVVYSDNLPEAERMKAEAESGRYTPSDQMLVLAGSPRVTNGGMATTANVIRINRASGDAVAEGDVKSTYSELKEQPNGALLAASSPIHVTAHTMVAHKSPAAATYHGNARLWQDANVIEAPTIQFDRDRRSVVAEGTKTVPVQTVLVEVEKASEKAPDAHQGAIPGPARTSPITITARRLSYVDSDRKVQYEGGVLAKGADFTASSRTADAYLLPRSQTTGDQALSATGRLDRMVAQGNVLIEQANRQARGQNLTYTTADDKFVLTGGPPSIFDAEQGKITGVSLTFFRRDDRVLVEGQGSTPVVTTTRVAR
ncbi:MAG TPA: LPS export ABC transporter periplasmic protein LptC [Candidatus Sulfotelmatobacter sp.]|nr:LPS export ABC transporter periplasmic protein LptC [Candidatus Sulfotelmatobacter sp.]